MKKSYFVTYGSNCSTDEVAHLLKKSLDLEFAAHESSYLGEYYKYSGLYADKITIRVNREAPGDRNYDKYREYRTLIFVGNVDGKNADKLSKTKNVKGHFKQIGQLTFIEEEVFEE